MLDLLHNSYTYPALVVVVVLVACAHVYRHDSPALLLDGLLVVAALGSQARRGGRPAPRPPARPSGYRRLCSRAARRRRARDQWRRPSGWRR